MHRTSISIYLFCHLVSVDIQEDKHFTRMQRECMKNALLLPENLITARDGGIFGYFLGTDSDTEDCCSWRGVECTSGTVTELVLTTYDAQERIWHVDILWLPNTIRYLCIQHSVLHSTFSLEQLPRDLQYLRIRNGMLRSEPLRKTVNLERLPRNIEELSVEMDDPLCGTVYIPSLSSKLVRCYLRSFSIRVVIVDNNSLPKNMRQVMIIGQKAKFWSVDGKKLDDRIGPAGKPMYIYPAKYDKTFELKERAIFQDLTMDYE